MVLLIHHPVSAISRKIRLLMAEKRILFVLREEEPWNLSPEIYKLNVAGELPIFIFDGNVIAGNYAITEFLEEVNPDVRLIGGDARQKAEIRRLTEWFDLKFEREVGRSLINEKVFKRFGKGLAPDSKVLKTALNNLNFHMEYIDWLCESRNYLAGSSFSLADVAAAAVVFENQVPPRFQRHFKRQHQGNSPCQTLCQPGFLNMKKILFFFAALPLLSACASGDGSVVYHWERYNTGIEKFARDHNACMREAESFSMMPRMKTLWHSMFYTEEQKLAIRADWDADKGIWATYIPYPGAQPLIVNYLRDDADVDPGDYSDCMKSKGYTIRSYEIPEITNIRLHGRSN